MPDSIGTDDAQAPRRRSWPQSVARIPVLVNAGLLVFDAAIYPSLPDQLLHHSSGKCWAAWISALLMPAIAVCLGLVGSLALRYIDGDTGRIVSLVPDFLAWTFCFGALYGLIPAAEGHRCL